MFCPRCGTNNNEGAAFCAGCGAQLKNAQTTSGNSGAATTTQAAPFTAIGRGGVASFLTLTNTRIALVVLSAVALLLFMFTAWYAPSGQLNALMSYASSLSSSSSTASSVKVMSDSMNAAYAMTSGGTILACLVTAGFTNFIQIAQVGGADVILYLILCLLAAIVCAATLVCLIITLYDGITNRQGKNIVSLIGFGGMVVLFVIFLILMFVINNSVENPLTQASSLTLDTLKTPKLSLVALSFWSFVSLLVGALGFFVSFMRGTLTK